MKLTEIFGKKSGASLSSQGGDCCLPDEIISEEERRAIQQSYDIYCGRAPFQTACEGGLALACGICSELSRLALSEGYFAFEKSKSGDYLQSSFEGFFSRLKVYTEFALATGGVMLKPYYDGKSLGIEVFLPDSFLPLGVDCAGNINACAFVTRLKRGTNYYTKIEEHIPTDTGYLVQNRLYVSSLGFDRGKPCSLGDIPEWKGISPSVTLENIKSPMFAYFAIPLGNIRHPHSPLGVPIFRRAESLIRQADLQYGRILWEFEGGELAVDASEDAFRVGKNGKPELPLGKERLYRTNTLDACNSTGVLLQTYAPQLRDRSLINGLNRIVMFIEDACGIARGTFSDPCEVAKTATEVLALRQRTASTVDMIRQSLKSALSRLTDACCNLMTLYNPHFGRTSISCRFGDGIIIPSETLREQERCDLEAGIISADEYKTHWYSDRKGGI